MTRPPRLRRPELHRRRAQQHRAARTSQAGDSPNARLMVEVDHLRRVLNKVPADQANGLVDQATTALKAITATHEIARRKGRKR